MICEYCNKEYNITESWKSERFCSKTCRGKYSNINKIKKSKDNLHNKLLLASSDPKLSPRDLGGNYSVAVEILCRCNPLRPFSHAQFSNNNSILKWIVRNYVNNKDIINSLSDLSNKYNSTGLMYNFLLYVVHHFPHISKELSNLYKNNSTWDIAKIFNLDQRTIRRIYGKEGLNVTSRSMRSSKIHLQTKPIIEKILGVKTETEHYLSGYWIDEFSEELKLCIEIDGEWCHNKEYDRIRDDKLLSLGYRTIRIPAYSDIETIENILNPYKKNE